MQETTPVPKGTAVIFARVASTPQRESSSSAIDRQVRACIEAAEAHDLKVTDTFSEVGISGNKTRRIGLHNLIRHLKDNPTDYVIVYDHARLSRIRENFKVLAKRIEATGARLLFANDMPNGN
ncbi:MAG: recombinase family protein [Micrococcales bacterium]|nr:recombinase family protein [Micrococcales bacterium]MCL2667609.1 recombinase family protein [Micrococcales bacterium]